MLGIAQTVVHPLLRARLKLPVKVVATLLPFRGRIMYDGIMYGERGVMTKPEEASKEKAAELFEVVKEAEATGAVVSNLSAVGPLSSQYGAKPESKSAASKSNKPVVVSPEVAAAAARVAKLPKIDGNSGFWVARRVGYTKEDNPNNMFIIIQPTAGGGGAGPMGAPVVTQRLNPTALELAEAMANAAERIGKRPEFYAVDCMKAIPELKAAFSSNSEQEPWANGGVVVDYYAPPSAEETKQINDMPH